VRVAGGGVVRVVRVVPVIQVVLVVVGISVEVGEEASSAVVTVSETVVTEAPANEAAAPELSASRDARTDAATATESTDVAGRMTSRHGSQCRIASRREREESSEQEDPQATVSIPCGRHEHTMHNRQLPCHPPGRAGPIIQYLAAKTGDHGLWPSEPKRQADVSRWQCWELAHWGPACGTLVFERFVKKFFGQGDPNPTEVARGEEEFHRFAEVLKSPR